MAKPPLGCRRGGPVNDGEYPHGMRFGIEHVLVQYVDFGVGVLDQIQVLERFGQKETLHLVTGSAGCVLDVAERPVPDPSLAILFDRLEGFPPPLPVHGIPRELVQNEERFDRLGSEQIMWRTPSNLKVLPGHELYVLGRYARVHARVHLIARVREGFAGGQIPLRTFGFQSEWIRVRAKG